jgi:L-asparaginase
LRGNRAKKYNAEKFEAFQSPNYPPLAEAATRIKYNYSYIRERGRQALHLSNRFDTHVGVLKVFPGMTRSFVEHLLSDKELKGLIIEGFGAGNVPTHEWFFELLKQRVSEGMLIVVLTQCHGGGVELGKYSTSAGLLDAGCIDGKNLTFEACLTKMMLILGHGLDHEEAREQIITDWSGELGD